VPEGWAAAAAAFEETLEDLGFTDGELGDPVEVGRRAALLVSAESVWKHRLGQLMDSKEVARLLQTSADEVVKETRQNRLLGLPMRNGTVLFPSFQFTKAGKLNPAVPAVLQQFQGAVVSAFTIASWFVSSQSLLRRETPAKWLEKSRDPQLVIEAARRTAQHLGQ
jgi:hypothetical protein